MTSPRQHNTPSARGFTMVELLVSMLILITLASIVVPGLKRGISKKDRTICAGNLKALQKALIIQASDDPYNPVIETDPSDTTFLRDFVGLTFDQVRCPLAPDGQLGYAINGNIHTGGALKASGELPYANIAIYEVPGHVPAAVEYRHNGNTQAITLYGDLIYTDNLDVSYVAP